MTYEEAKDQSANHIIKLLANMYEGLHSENIYHELHEYLNAFSDLSELAKKHLEEFPDEEED